MMIDKNTLDQGEFNTQARLPFELRLDDFRMAVRAQRAWNSHGDFTA